MSLKPNVYDEIEEYKKTNNLKNPDFIKRALEALKKWKGAVQPWESSQHPQKTSRSLSINIIL